MTNHYHAKEEEEKRERCREARGEERGERELLRPAKKRIAYQYAKFSDAINSQQPPKYNMQAGAKVNISSERGNARRGRVLHRVLEEPLHVDRYLVRIDRDVNYQSRSEIFNLDQLTWLGDPDRGTDDMMTTNGMSFCRKHGLEVCGKSSKNFRPQNLVQEIDRQLYPSWDDAQGIANAIKRSMDNAGLQIRQAPLPMQPMITRRSTFGPLLDGSILPENTDPEALGDLHDSQLQLLLRGHHMYFPVASPL